MPTLGETFAYLFDVGLDILASTLDPETGTITSQLGDVTKDRVDSQSAENWWGAPGIVGNPAAPDQGSAGCQTICIKRSNHDLIIAYRDLRSSSIYGNLKPGETCVYATTGMARGIFKSNGSARLFTTDDNTENGNSIFVGVSSFYQGADGQQHLGGEVRWYAPFGGAWQDPTGFHLRTFHGTKLDIGGLTLPAPIGATARTFSVDTDVFSAKAQSVKLGNGAAFPVVLAPQLQALMESFAGDLATFTTAVTTFATAVGAAPIVGAAAGPLGVAATALGVAANSLMATILIATGATSTAAS